MQLDDLIKALQEIRNTYGGHLFVENNEGILINPPRVDVLDGVEVVVIDPEV